MVALCPRGGRGEMVDRANEVELGAWRWGRRCSCSLGKLLELLSTFILRREVYSTVPFCHYLPAPVPARSCLRSTWLLVIDSIRISQSYCTWLISSVMFVRV